MGRSDSSAAKLERLEEAISRHVSALVSFSGGVDSALVARVASRKTRALAVIGDSPALPRSELAHAREFCASQGIALRVVSTDEYKREGYLANAGDRCYFCKSTLYATLKRIAAEAGYPVLLDGTNLSDLGEDRPGLRAAREEGVFHPLVEAGMTKEDVREVSLHLGLPTWDKPSAPCLASRIPVGRRVTFEALEQVERAEELLKSAGFRVVRVRHLGDRARVELGEGEHDEGRFAPLVPRLLDVGFREVELSPVPYVEPHLRVRP